MRKRCLRIVLSECLMVVMVTTGVLFFAPAHVAHAESVVVGEACSGEGGKLRGCKAGDQSGREVDLGRWSYGGASKWDFVLRAKDPSIAKKLAENMKAACENDHIGYDQDSSDRNSLYDCAKANDWDIAGITTNCETTCASVVSVCLNAAGVDVPRTWYSGLVKDDLMATGQFECFTSRDYVASPDKLLPGDILVNDETHTAMVVESPNLFEFEVKYQDTEGEEQVIMIEEGSEIQLNFNNGKQVETVTITDNTDLAEYKPEKRGAKFYGWDYKDGESFVANYKSSVKSMHTDGKIVKIK